MGIYRHGARAGFFDGTTTFNQSTNPGGGVAVPIGATSKPQQLGQGSDNFSFFVSVTGAPAFATRWQLQVAHSGDPTLQGNMPDQSGTGLGVWHDAWYLGTSGAGNSTSIWLDIPSGGGSVMTFVPDFSGGWARLHRTDVGNAAVTVLAGWEEMSD